jgi:phosphoribosyl-ATP pyrophosphohydrolase
MTFEELYNLLESKRSASPADSQTAKYLELGIHQIGKKVIEEAAEAWMAAEFQSKEETATEISQLLYWTVLLAIASEIDLATIENEL